MSRYLFLRSMIFFIVIVSAAFVTGAKERFTNNGDGTVTDHKTGLMWAKNDNNGNITWNQAEKWVHFTFPYTLPTLYTNWRMPSIEELKSLVAEAPESQGYESDCGQWVKIVPYIRLSCGWIWSAETDPVAPTARIFNFNNVCHYTVRKAQKRAYRILPVRNLK